MCESWDPAPPTDTTKPKDKKKEPLIILIFHISGVLRAVPSVTSIAPADLKRLLALPPPGDPTLFTDSPHLRLPPVPPSPSLLPRLLVAVDWSKDIVLPDVVVLLYLLTVKVVVGTGG